MEPTPNFARAFESDCWYSPTSYEQQSLLLLDIQARHQKILHESGLASKAFASLSPYDQDMYGAVVPSLQKYMVFRRIYPNTPSRPENITFGVAFAIRNFSKSNEPITKYIKYVHIGDYIDGIVLPRRVLGRAESEEYDDNDRQLVCSLVHELTDYIAQGMLPNLKFVLTDIKTEDDTTAPHPPLNY